MKKVTDAIGPNQTKLTGPKEDTGVLSTEMSVIGLSDLCSFGSHDAVGQLVALITQFCFEPGCG